ncbi:ACP phosphodiesterase [Paraflavitalea sp. CAU 1676]|uniref:acyl carrier protein phosphodiesterase n=1 Tax=Paraflavitalea sp. CAU 1676 TaxID=3032598 RepID=UPI0023DB9A9A|nr:ACP phosphodiesterase [Paraflavitalea sp. CAU 1676]MDF2190790.1 ACP phosphodiesterase [Paraflavitalea sp. CAU 1676]
MNYLAHAYLSFNIPPILVGNMISDFVKGKKQFDFAPDVQQGIRLHRAIDQFTDEHPATARAKEVFRPHYRLYSGAFVDVVYDHFLARDVNQFSNDRLFDFSQTVYSTLEQYAGIFPRDFQLMFPYMKKHNWLYHYGEPESIGRSFEGLVRRSAYLTESKIAFGLFERHYDEFQVCYDAFFPEVKSFVRLQLETFDNK